MPAPVDRTRPQLRHGLVLAAILTGPTWATGVVAAIIQTYWAGWFMVVAVVLTFVAANQLFPEARIGLVAAGTLAMLAAILTLTWMPLAVLDVRGDPVTAVVTAERAVQGKPHSYEYQLRRLDGQPIAGVLAEHADVYDPGDEVAVVVDRYRQLNPMAADALSTERATGIAAASLLALATGLSIAVGSRWSMERVEIRFRSRYRPRH